ncbi:MAG: T9SS type A sorting domain-containing protein [Saprospiraceae bacterium]|nr:T9SS type A sorting domain-containing protein [Candidatus Opimibacter skivensis]
MKDYCITMMLVLLASSISLKLIGQELPAYPNTQDVMTCFPDTTGYVRITVGPVGRDYRDLQEAIDAAPLGSVLILDAGAVFNGGFILPDKGNGEEWIVLISSRMDLLPAEVSRLSPSASTGDQDFPNQSSAMPKIITNNLSGIPCFKTQAYAHHYRLVGLEITADNAVINSYGLVNLGDASSAQNSLDLVPHHFVIDRCYIHGHTDATVMKYGIRLDCANAAIIESYISDFHSIGFDAQAISGINGPGPFKILNNYLEASGENILFGGGAAAIAGLVPSDIEIRHNYFYKPWSWRVDHPDYAGKHWTIKNLFELKTGKRVWLDGNVLENCWADLPIGQSGYAILLTVRTESGGSPQADVSDVVISNNIIRHVGAGITLSGADGNQGNRSSRILIANNLFEDINGPAYGDLNTAGPNDGTFIKIGEPIDVTIDHNSIFQTGPITWAYQVSEGFRYANNLSHSFVSAGGYQGIYGPGQSQGNNTIANYFPDITDANQHFHQNVLIGGNASRYTNFNTISQNHFPTDISSVGFSDYAGGVLDYHGYALAGNSPFANAGTNGEDIGVNMEALDAALIMDRSCDSIPTKILEIPPFELPFQLYPNPAGDEFFITTTSPEQFAYSICDLTGRELQAGTYDGNKTRIDARFIPAGMYVVHLVSKDVRGSRIMVIR